MKRVVTYMAALAGIIVLAYSATAAARPASSTSSPTPLGIDISWPQCGKTVPKTQAFGIVGVNGGLATTTNPCLKDQLVWATQSLGGTAQAKVQLYLNTANPGGLNTASWPKNNTDPTGAVSPNSGTCTGSDSLACAWQYGWNRAAEAVHDRFVPAATAAKIDASAAAYTWWLDVETENTWKLSGSSFDTQSNVAVLEGMTAYIKSVNGQVGLYSTGAQWNQIVGTAVTSSSNLNGLRNWRPGGANLSTAKDACKAAPLTSGGQVTLTQYVAQKIDYDYSCV